MCEHIFFFLQLLGVWIVSEWMGAGRPKQLQLVELGPGKGSLASDVLRVRNTSHLIYYSSRTSLIRENEKNMSINTGILEFYKWVQFVTVEA